MTWKKVDPALTAAFGLALNDIDCDHKTMFGCPVAFVNGNMFAGKKARTKKA